MDEHKVQEEQGLEAQVTEACECGHEHHHDEHEHEEHGHHHGHHDHYDHEEHEQHHHEHHEHDHDEHGHHHHHHHHEDEECECGHHHDHDHDHEHDHHHHHDHGHQYEIAGFRIFETHSHEGATICSFEKDVRKEQAEVVALMEQCIHALEKWLDETDAVIGHVKGYVKETGSVTTFSTVGYGLNVEQHEGDTISVGFAAIVIGPSEEALKDKVSEIFAAL